jgi:macrolide transport system ATP-binding/permease protein
MTGLAQDVRYALRQLRSNPGFATVSILVLALGMCASIAIFGFVDAALLKPLPYGDPDRLLMVTESSAVFPRAFLSYYDYLDWKKLNQVFSSLDVYHVTGYLLSTPNNTELVHSVRVSDGFFRTLEVTPVLGRDFRTGEDLPQAPQTVMLSYATWQKRFGGRRDVLGQSVTLSGVPYTIIGVLPAGFQFAPQLAYAVRGDAEFWTTLHANDYCGLHRGCHNLIGIGRLKKGVAVEAARANIKAIAAELEIQYPSDNRGQTSFVESLAQALVSDIRPVLLALLGGAGLLLLIACVNVSSLLLVRSESRRREIAVRGALGASRLRLVRQFAVDSLVLVVVGTALGLVTAKAAMRILMSLISKDMLAGMPYLSGLGLHSHVIAFAAIISVASLVLFTLAPVLRLPLSQIREGLAEGGRGYAGTLWRRFGANLVAVELAVAVVLLVGAGLLGKSFYRLLHVDLGFNPDHLATVTVFSGSSYPKDEQQIVVARRIMDQVRSLPGVKSVGITDILPVSGGGTTWWIRFVGRPYNGEHNEVNQRPVSTEYFSTMQARLLRGRYFTENEDATKNRVVLINEALARKYFPGEDPIRKQIGDFQLTPDSIAEIIGVVQDVKDGPLDSEVWPAVYHPFNQDPDNYFSVVARTSQDERSVLPGMVAAIQQVDRGFATLDESTMADRIGNSPSAYFHRSSAWLVGGFAGMALLLGVIGLYGVIAYSVSRRTREIGVRMALGAQRRAVSELIMKEAVRLTAIGIVGGLAASVGAAALIRGLLFGVPSWDIATLVCVSVVLSFFALLASYIPARRAAKVDPMVALRYE